ncbi:MAG TPA: CHAT domain-containing protein, partial [Acidimicrobiia bacterium]|nr:CHAT domain-containing protein [Acidimicrobiia bacterium]
LNSCEGARTSPTDPFAGTAQSLVQQGIPAVIAMQFEITDEAAILLSHEFYAALSDGYPVDTALGEARKAIFASGNEVEWATPVLYMRSANGRIFRLARPDASERPKTAAVEEPVVPPPTPEVKPPADVPQPSPVRTIEAPLAAPTLQPTAPTPAAVEEPTVPAPAAVAEPTVPTPTKPYLPRLPANLILIGAALALLSSGQYLSDSPELVWFMPEKLLAIAGSAAVAFLVLSGRQPPGGIGAALGLGLYLLAVTLPFVYNDDSGLFVANLGLAIGSGLIVGGAIALLRRSPQSEPGSVGWLPALGGLLVGVALFLPVTSSDGPEFVAVIGEWLVGNRQAVLLPLLLLAAWVFILSLYPSRRVSEQRGQLLGVGAELLVAFPTMVGYFTLYEGWGTAFGLWIAIIGAALVVVGSWRAIRQAKA